MTARTSTTKLTVFALAVLMAGAAWAQVAPRPLIALNLTSNTALGATATAVYETLRASGQYELWAAKTAETDRVNQPLACLVHEPGMPLPKQAWNPVDFVNSGGGLVLIVPTERKWMGSHPRLVSLLGLQMVAVPQQGAELLLRSHPVTEGLTGGVMKPIGTRLESALLDPLISQGGHTIALAGTVGQGRVVVLVEPLVASTDLTRAPDPDRVKLLAQAAQWAAGRDPAVPGAGTITGPELPGTQTPRIGLTAKAVVDLPAEAAWRELSAAVAEGVQRAGLPLETFAYRQDTDTLAQVMARYPALLVVGSYREYEEGERALLSQYVADGGALLALGWCRDGNVTLLSAFNRLLTEFGISMTYARPGGAVKILEHPATRGVPREAMAPAGCAIWAFADWPLATVGEQAIATAHQIGRGKVVVMDGAALLPSTDKAITAEATATLRQLLGTSVQWLCGK